MCAGNCLYVCVHQATCAACDFNTAESDCKRPLKWAWRGDMTPASRSDYEGVKMQVYIVVYLLQYYTKILEHCRLK
jgi:hypothetical protein